MEYSDKKTNFSNEIDILQRFDIGYPELIEYQSEIMLEEDPNDFGAICLKSASLRLQGNAKQALLVLNAINVNKTKNATLLQELGFVYRQLGENNKAIDTFREALNIDESLAMSWNAISVLANENGNNETSKLARENYLKFLPLKASLRYVQKLISNNELSSASAICNLHLAKNPNNESALRCLGLICRNNNSFDRGLELFGRCLSLNSADHYSRYQYASILLELHKYSNALEEVNHLLSISHNNIDYLRLKGRILSQSGKYEPSCQHYEKSLMLYPKNTMLLIDYAQAKRAFGDYEGAVDILRTVTISRHSVYSNLANLKKFKFSDKELEEMLMIFKEVNKKSNSYSSLSFAIGKAYEDKADYDTAFKYFQYGNSAKKLEEQYKPSRFEHKVNIIISMINKEVIEANQKVGSLDNSPIFIVGLPRSGSTLLEQILASHSQVQGTKELKDIAQIFHRAFGGRNTKDSIRNLLNSPAKRFYRLGEEYIKRTTPLRDGRPFFIDKMPGNFVYLGFISLILPNAKIIDARRHPMATGFSNFKQLFAHGQGFSYDLNSFGLYYKKYVELMEHWERILPGNILRVNYENVVNDIDSQVKRILKFCDLPYEKNCLSFHKTKRAVRTISSEQVRSPLYTGSVEQWRCYEKHLGMLQDSLGKTIEHYEQDIE